MNSFKVRAKLKIYRGPRKYNVTLKGITLKDLGHIRSLLREYQWNVKTNTRLGTQFEEIIKEAERKS